LKERIIVIYHIPSSHNIFFLEIPFVIIYFGSPNNQLVYMALVLMTFLTSLSHMIHML